MLRMTSAICVVVRISVHVGVDNGRAIDDVRMGKESNIRVVTCEKRYEKERCYFLYF